MLALISPAKKLNFDLDHSYGHHTQPEFIDSAERLVTAIRRLSRADLARTMKLSDTLADLNYQRFKDFHTPFDLGNAKQAALVFNGDTYVGLDAATMSTDDLAFAQDHLRILSGLYGLLRPLDLIQPYRLEMGARFSPPRRSDLYDFWGATIADALNAVLSDQAEPVVINLASNEYFKAVKAKDLSARVITPAFKEIKGGETRMLGMFAKQARGMMARYMIAQRATKADDLKSFNSGGYEFRADLSEADNWVFTRDQPAPPR